VTRRECTAGKWIQLVLLLLAALAAVATVTATAGTARAGEQATAAYAPLYLSWRFTPGQVCVQTTENTFWPAAGATRNLNYYSDIWAVPKASCAAYPATKRISLRAYQSAWEYCARTGRLGWQWIATGVSTGYWTPKDTIIYLNTHWTMKRGCFDTWHKRSHVIHHELLHAYGGNCGNIPPGESIMWTVTGWRYAKPTWLDYYRISYFLPDSQ
jgi:hypothetical protein